MDEQPRTTQAADATTGFVITRMMWDHMKQRQVEADARINQIESHSANQAQAFAAAIDQLQRDLSGRLEAATAHLRDLSELTRRLGEDQRALAQSHDLRTNDLLGVCTDLTNELQLLGSRVADMPELAHELAAHAAQIREADERRLQANGSDKAAAQPAFEGAE